MSNNWPFKLDSVEDWAFWKKAFTKEECEKIMKLGKQNLKKALTQNPSATDKYRKSKVYWILPNPETQWIFQKLTNICMELNDKYFKFHVEGFLEGLQFTNYKSKGGHYKKHIDKGFNRKIRKLSISIQLTDPKEYEGGELKFYFEDKPQIMSKEQGTLIMFPSYVLHEVTPVTKGERNSLVAWISGDNFK